MTPRGSVTLVGAGPVGALMANYLATAGYRVEMYEKREDIREAEMVVGRSINLALSARGLDGLGGVGLADAVLKEAVPMRGRMMHAVDGALTYQPYDKDPTRAINSVSRGGLNVLLLHAAARHPEVALHFHERCVDVDFITGAATFENTKTGARTTARNDFVIGADGAWSAIRAAMQKLDRFEYSQAWLGHGYKELHIPPAAGGGFQMEKNALHIWPRRSHMMIALPNADGSFTVTCFWAFEGADSFANLKTEAEVLAYFGQVFPDAVALMPSLAADFLRGKPGSMVTVRCAPWHVGSRVVLLGDAAHAVVPFYGQGMNAGFEDCRVLFECLQAAGADHEAAFRAYDLRRKENTDTLARLAVDNFIEMRDKVSDPAFLRRKRREKTLHRLLPNWYTPLYSMISFSTIPYAEAVRRAAEQEETIRRVERLLAWLLVLVLVAIIIYFW